MSISQSCWGFARGIELPKGPQTTWHQPRLCSAAIPSYMDIPSSGPWHGVSVEQGAYLSSTLPHTYSTFSCSLGCFQLLDYPLN